MVSLRSEDGGAHWSILVLFPFSLLPLLLHLVFPLPPLLSPTHLLLHPIVFLQITGVTNSWNLGPFKYIKVNRCILVTKGTKDEHKEDKMAAEKLMRFWVLFFLFFSLFCIELFFLHLDLHTCTAHCTLLQVFVYKLKFLQGHLPLPFRLRLFLLYR